ncbi:UCR 6-4kD domain containing protein [Asbolus verrucosus]|uniref:UCR 6-4kD domain containing protein n=1 Tax=Asbolus verrucosus TaxID=1661398 RepID=A0A482VYL6_ASBVE|nr:UCR 6-4kD domain containing protein [Asbolus verrucosus]
MVDHCEEEDPRKAPRKNVEPSRKPKPVQPPAKTASADKRPIVEFPHMLRIIGPKHIKIMMQFVPSAIIYSITSLILLTYMSEWKTVLQYLPYYNGKYYVESTDSKKDDE